MPPDSVEEQWDVIALEKKLLADYAIKISVKSWLKKEPDIAIEGIANRVKEMANQSYLTKEKLAGSEALHHFEQIVSVLVLSIIGGALLCFIRPD